MTPTFSIITTCKGRLEHLKRSLPAMLAQKGAEVIVVDYSCPDGTADYVTSKHPQAKLVRVDGQNGFSNWNARNRGAAVATGDILLFCDADTILAKDAVQKLATLPAKSFGFFSRLTTEKFNRSGSRLAKNQLRGFHVIPARVFKALGGYDDVPVGYAAGGDTDLEDRMIMRGLKAVQLGDGIVEDVIEHPAQTRFTHHADPITLSYAAGLLYRRAKLALLRQTMKANLPLKTRQNIYRAARNAAQDIVAGKNVATLSVAFEKRVIGMPRQLGFEQGEHTASIVVRINMKNKMDRPPE